jgi:hypothetical protein
MLREGLRAISEVLHHYMPGGTEENQGQSVKISVLWVKI